MLERNDLIKEFSEFIRPHEVTFAYGCLVGWAIGSPVFRCCAHQSPPKDGKENKRDFQFHDLNYQDNSGKHPFSFIVNQQWLTFYLRSPAVESEKYDKEELKGIFTKFKSDPNSANEWTLRVENVDDAQRLIDEILKKWSS